jgi:hypothetical protein
MTAPRTSTTRSSTMATIRSFLLLPLLLGAASAQQFLVVPNHRATTEGNTLDVKPFGYRQVRSEHYLARSQLLPLGAAAAVTQVAYRRDGPIAGTFVRGDDATTTWGVRMANAAPPDPVNPGSLYYPAGQLSTVFAPRVVVWPSLPPPAAGTVAPFNIQFNLDAPFQYTGGHLLISHYCYSVSMGGLVVFGYMIDAEGGVVPGTGTVTTFGTSCPAGANRASAVAPNPGGGNLSLFLHDAPPSSLSLLYLGGSDTSWLGIPLPLSLLPAGLPGCSILVELASAVALVIEPSGLGSVALAVPGDPALLSARLFAQFLNVQDPRVNPALSLATSEALDIRLGGNLGAVTQEMSNVTGTFAQTNGPGGFVSPGEGPIVQLRY